MIIYGVKTISGTLKSGRFDCPNCRRKESYKLKNYKEYFHIFFIPLFKVQELGDELSCFFCNTVYIPASILSKEEEYDTRNNSVNYSRRENEGLGHEPCDSGKRAGAYILDFLIVYIINLVIMFYEPAHSSFFLFTAFSYFIGCDFAFKGSSLGKLALSIKIADFDENHDISFYNIIFRNLIKGICCYFPPIFMISYLNQDKRTIHDMLAKTIVIDK